MSNLNRPTADAGPVEQGELMTQLPISLLSEVGSVGDERHQAHRAAVATLCWTVRRAPWGRGGRKRKREPFGRDDRKETSLYKAITATGISRRALVHGILWDIVNTLDRFAVARYLKSELDEAATAKDKARSKIGDLEALVAILVVHKPEVFDLLDELGCEKLRVKVLERGVKVLTRIKKANDSHSKAREAYRRQRWIGEVHRGAAKVELNQIVWLLCDEFRAATGGPHHGLVGQLLWATGVDPEEGSYEERRNRTKQREKSWVRRTEDVTGDVKARRDARHLFRQLRERWWRDRKVNR